LPQPVRAKNPPKNEFIDTSGMSYNTISPNDFGFFEDLNQLIQKEPIDSLDPETRGLVASIGIVKGKPFKPDARMKKLLTEAVAIGNATARAIIFQPREKDAYIYPDSDSAWVMPYAGKDVFFEVDGARNLDARTMFYYAYTAISPAMVVTKPGGGSDYGFAYLDSKKRPLDGSKSYKLHLPPKVPANNFWAVTLVMSMMDMRAEPIIVHYPAFQSRDVSLETSGLDHYIDIPLATSKGDFKKPTTVLYLLGRHRWLHRRVRFACGQDYRDVMQLRRGVLASHARGDRPREAQGKPCRHQEGEASHPVSVQGRVCEARGQGGVPSLLTRLRYLHQPLPAGHAVRRQPHDLRSEQ
jgi:hypothetical protein